MEQYIDKIDHSISFKIPIMYRENPYIYIKASTVCNSYRLSGNYKYLNEQYQLKINFIRDLNKINKQHWNNKYFNIDKENTVSTVSTVSTINTKEKASWQIWNLTDNPLNSLIIHKLIIKDDRGDTTIIILNRDYNGDKNSSIFFSSNGYYTINQFLDITDLERKK